MRRMMRGARVAVERPVSLSPSSSPLAGGAAAPGGDDDKAASNRCGLSLSPESESLAVRYTAKSRVAFTLNHSR